MDIAMVVVFLLISFVYFQTPITQGMELGGHDSDAAMNQGREQADYRASHDGETSRWTNAMFSGMPTYQIAPSYSATQFLAHISDIYNLGTKGALLRICLSAWLLRDASRLQLPPLSGGAGRHHLGLLLVFLHHHRRRTYLEGDDAGLHPANHRRPHPLLSRTDCSGAVP